MKTTRIAVAYLTLGAAACTAPPPEDGYEQPPVTTTGGGSGVGGAGVGGTTVGAGGTTMGVGGTNVVGGSGGQGGTPAVTGGATGTGAAGGVGGSTGNSGTPPEFELMWEDNFDVFNTARWAKAGHTFPENLGQFSPDNAIVEGGLLKLRITNVATEERPYTAGEVYTHEQFQYGRFEARIKFAAGSGIVSSLFTYKDDAGYLWNEIDIEYLGNLPQSVQYNLITSAPGGDNLQYQPWVDFLGISPYAEFRTYRFEWTPTQVRFFVDDLPRHIETENVAERMRNPARLRMNCWPTNNEVTTFAGTLDHGAIPAEAQYDWVRVYRYVGN